MPIFFNIIKNYRQIYHNTGFSNFRQSLHLRSRDYTLFFSKNIYIQAKDTKIQVLIIWKTFTFDSKNHSVIIEIHDQRHDLMTQFVQNIS